jgi:hydrogenase maturation protein HypF
MAAFKMCSDCDAEYNDPADRRFHAQPDACFECGPHISLWDKSTPLRHSGLDPESTREPTDAFSDDPESTREPADAFSDDPESSQEAAVTPLVGYTKKQSDAIIERVSDMLIDGHIVAIKGLGGYHLACDATNEQAVCALRERKHRPAKPFAIMVRTLDEARAICDISDAEADALTCPAHPIVLLQVRHSGTPLRQPGTPLRHSGLDPESTREATNAFSNDPESTHCSDDEHSSSTIAPSVAGDLPELGVMLAYTPVQHLLLACVGRPLVMTSGNLSEEPIAALNGEAHERLANIADAFLDNDRDIVSRYDDSVIRVIDERIHMVRRARGYAPKPLTLPSLARIQPAANGGYQREPLNILATGPEQKSTFCLTRGNDVFVSQHLGDLEDAASFDNYLDTLSRYEHLFSIKPTALACDMHPNYLASKWAREQAATLDIPLVEVQHHHAHIAAVLAENMVARTYERQKAGDRVIGIAMDGTGYGPDGAIWGGEVLIATCGEYERYAHLPYIPLPGGKAAIEHPERMAYAMLKRFDLLGHPAATDLLRRVTKDERKTLDAMIDGGINTPVTSSVGRVFDAVSALLGVCTEETYDGQPAIELEAAMYGNDKALAYTAQHFHNAVIQMIVDACNKARADTGIEMVALSGGVFMNRYLATNVPLALGHEGFTVLQHIDLPANDGCIAYGQAVIATAQLTSSRA